MKRLFIVLVTIFSISAVVFPNSFRELTLPGIFLSALAASMLALNKNKSLETIYRVWLLSAAVTIIYLIVGMVRGYSEALPQVIFVYIISPLLWIIVVSRLFAAFPCATILRAIIVLGLAGSASVFAFHYLYTVYGAASLTWLISEPNAQMGRGQAGATMHVFGSLLFIIGGFFAAPEIIKSLVLRLLSGGVFAAAAVLSGRTALLIAAPLGLSVYLLARSDTFSLKSAISKFTYLAITGVLIAQLLSYFGGIFDFDVEEIVKLAYKKIGEGGGSARVEQARALVNGITDSWFLGAGHGTTVSVVRDDMNPWRYEALWLATIYRVGVVGALVYLIPSAIVFFQFARELRHKMNRPESNFIFGGFVAFLLASATNPYPESFEFQWMLVFPYVYFAIRSTMQPEAARVGGGSFGQGKLE